MFTNGDYAEYFIEVEDLIKKVIVIYTDMLNELSDNSFRSKIEPVARESMDTFRFMKELREKFFGNKET